MNMNTPTRPIEILMVEDSPSDALVAREALAYAKVLNTLHVVDNGDDAMAFLRREGKFAGVPQPDMILLDLKLPGKSGQEVLVEIKSDENLKHIPVVILTTSRNEEDVLKAYDHYANCYITKPVNFENFSEVVRSIENFWFTVVTLPRQPPNA
jgi:two-component system response regulator